MPTQERNASPVQRTDLDFKPYADLEEEVTPRPHDITAADAWEHSTHVAKRTADRLSNIAHSAGVGMDVGDQVRQQAKDLASVNRKIKFWQALALAALTAAGSALVGVARGLYDRGEKEGISEMRLRSVEKTVLDNYRHIEKIREDMWKLYFKQPAVKDVKDE